MAHRIEQDSRLPAGGVQAISTVDLPRLGTRLGRFLQVIGTWYLRARSREALAMLDDRGLRDIGLTREDVSDELSKPFWR